MQIVAPMPLRFFVCVFLKGQNKKCSAEKTYNFPPTVIFANNFPQKVRESKMQQIATKKASTRCLNLVHIAHME